MLVALWGSRLARHAWCVTVTVAVWLLCKHFWNLMCAPIPDPLYPDPFFTLRAFFGQRLKWSVKRGQVGHAAEW